MWRHPTTPCSCCCCCCFGQVDHVERCRAKSVDTISANTANSCAASRLKPIIRSSDIPDYIGGSLLASLPCYGTTVLSTEVMRSLSLAKGCCSCCLKRSLFQHRQKTQRLLPALPASTSVYATSLITYHNASQPVISLHVPPPSPAENALFLTRGRPAKGLDHH